MQGAPFPLERIWPVPSGGPGNQVRKGVMNRIGKTARPGEITEGLETTRLPPSPSHPISPSHPNALTGSTGRLEPP